MLEKLIHMTRAQDQGGPRPVMLAIAGDSASGKTTLTKGLAQAIGEDRCLTICVDDYHRYDREERKGLPFTPLHPDCNYVDIIEQHLQLLALGRPILKPLYDHATGAFTRPQYVEPREFVIVEGLHPLATKLTRACFDVKVFLDPPEEIRHEWKIERDMGKRGYTREQVLAELERREPESEAYIPLPRQRDVFPVREAALLWVPSGGWQLAVETSSTEDMIILGSTTGTPVPQPSAVLALCEDYLHPSPR